ATMRTECAPRNRISPMISTVMVASRWSGSRRRRSGIAPSVCETAVPGANRRFPCTTAVDFPASAGRDKIGRMRVLQHLFDNNKAWSEQVRLQDPQFFERLSQQQSPRFLWIGCSDSRVPANEIIGLPPGEGFVHRNVANVVVHTDLNCLSVMQFPIDLLKVEHVMVVGHYGCGGVRVALRGDRVGLADHWIGHVKDVAERHEARIRPLYHESHQIDRLCELNVIEQVHNVCQSTIVRDAWDRGQPLSVHGWIYGLNNGLLRDLGVTAQNRKEAAERYEAAIQALT